MINMRMVETEMIQGILILGHGIGATVGHDQTEEIRELIEEVNNGFGRVIVQGAIMKASLFYHNGVTVS